MKEEIKLYLKKDKKSYLSFPIDKETTCDSLLQNNKEIILKTLSSLYISPNLGLFEFYLIDMKSNKDDSKKILTQLRINKFSKIYYLLQSPHLMLSFLPIIEINYESRIKARNRETEKDLNNDFERDKFPLNNRVENTKDIIQNRTLFYYYPEKSKLIKSKANLNEKLITILPSSLKQKIKIFIDEILSYKFYEPGEPEIKNLKIKGSEIPRLFVIIKTKSIKYILGMLTESQIKTWTSGIRTVMNNYRELISNSNLNKQINSVIDNLYEKESLLINKFFILNDVFKLDELRQIFLDSFEDKNIASLIENIISFKKCLEKKSYIESLDKFVKIVNIIEPENYKKNDENFESLQKIEGILASDRKAKIISVFNSVKNLKEEEKNQFKELMTIDLFEELYSNIIERFFIPHFEKVKKILIKDTISHEKCDLRKKYEAVIPFYYLKENNMTNMDCFFEIVGDKSEGIFSLSSDEKE